MNILSIQSSVAYGHVGNSAAVFPLQRLGFSVWPVITVHFSNHLGYGAARGPVLPAEDVADVIRGIEERDVMADCDAVLSGYMGDASIGEVILDAVERVRKHRPDAVYCCDPVMGDVGTGFYVRPGIPEFMRQRAVPAATLVTPNQFELEYLTDSKVTDLASVLDAVDQLRAMGPDVVLVTSLRREDGPTDRIELLAVSSDGAWLLSSPLLPVDVNGAGDATAALFLAHWLTDHSIREALSKTSESIYSVLERTLSAGTREIQLIAAQDAIAHPPSRFDVEKVR
ncbi:MAG: pyridoxal kinase PdxY [Pseudomonadota bacterium]